MAKNPVSSNDDSEKAASYSVDSISDLIVNRIETGVYRQGDQLIARTIAQELGTSIAPVREALNRLKGEGLVEFFSNRSARVKELSDKELLDSLEVWQANAMLQVRLAAQRAGIRDNAERMRKSWRKIRSAGMRDDRLKFLQRVKEFSNLLKEICDNAYLDRVEKVVHTELWSRNVVDAIEDKDWIPYVEGFCAVGEAVIAGDQKAAEKAYANHLQRFTGHVLRKMARDK
ncbi:MAG: GntR family transcriptional regulator [Pseudomonadota bacterium]